MHLFSQRSNLLKALIKWLQILSKYYLYKRLTCISGASSSAILKPETMFRFHSFHGPASAFENTSGVKLITKLTKNSKIVDFMMN